MYSITIGLSHPINIKLMCNTCQNCYLTIKNRRTAGRGVGQTPTLTPTILFIGDCPSVLDYKNQQPFTGRNSKILTEYILKYKLGLWSYVTNIIQCNCPEPNNDYAEKCFPNLIETIRTVKPVLIIAVGTFAYRFLKEDNTRSMKHVVNKITTFNNSLLLPIYSPSYITKSKNFSEYDKSFKLISNIFADICKEYRWIKPE